MFFQCPTPLPTLLLPHPTPPHTPLPFHHATTLNTPLPLSYRHPTPYPTLPHPISFILYLIPTLSLSHILSYPSTLLPHHYTRCSVFKLYIQNFFYARYYSSLPNPALLYPSSYPTSSHPQSCLPTNRINEKPVI